MNKLFISSACLALFSLPSGAKEAARYDMAPQNGKITEVISGKTYDVTSLHGAEAVAGAKGDALRLDGYSTYVDAQTGNLISGNSMTASVWCAVETYPIVDIDVYTSEVVPIASCLDDTAKTGFGFFIGFDGRYSFKTYVGGWPLELTVSTPLQRNEWVNLTAVIDGDARTATLYNNGEVVAAGKSNGNLTVSESTMRIGRSFAERNNGSFCLTSFNGIIDDITLWDEALPASDITGWKPENPLDLSIPESRFADNVMRPRFHGMPGANWTNETHGMTYSDGRYHVFFQKNANGPYMARLHWGHISSENLYDWREEKIAITPGDTYDIKGCWSGCVFSDKAINDGKPTIVYTGVDYAKAAMVLATPQDDALLNWQKQGVIIPGRPSGLSDDFRDPYFFRNGNDAYLIVGSSKDGLGTATLHKYNPDNKSWSNDGKTFFSAANTFTGGTFWEMPNVTKIGDKWIFTVTPQGLGSGVACLYWVGSIIADGTFAPDNATPSYIELPGYAKDGYGMLSPTIYQKDGKTIAMGIVPDKLAGIYNADLGFAHTYSLPREWSLDADGKLCQKPYSGLTAMRSQTGYTKTGVELNGTLDLDGIEGRRIELLGEFTVGAGKCGFTLLDDGASSLKVYYDGATGRMTVDARGMDRMINDAHSFAGLYESSLPVRINPGERIKLNVFFDHSILDIFINDKYATSVRVFANSKETEGVTAFSDAPSADTNVQGWMLNATAGSSLESIIGEVKTACFSARDGMLTYNLPTASHINIYDLSGVKVHEHYADNLAGKIHTGLTGLHIVEARNIDFTHSQKVIF